MNKNWLFLILFTFPFYLFGQSNFTLTGEILDRESGEKLPGCSIHILNSEIGTSSDEGGNFLIRGLKSKTCRIEASFIGYKTDTLSIDFGKKDRIHIVIKLQPNSQQIAEVDIKGKAEGQVKASLQQKQAENIKNIVSAEQIEQFPDLNAGEAMQRIPGITLQRDQGEGRYVQLRGTPPEYTNFNVNGEQIPSPEGNVRYVGMDIISADQIDQIEITKVLTPDMDGDAIGGTVNITTKTASSEIPEINASLAGGYNNIRESNNYQAQFSFAQRHNNFGFVFNASQFTNHYGSDNMEFEYDKGTFFGSQSDSVENYHIQYKEAQLRHYEITRKRTGISSTLDYTFNPESFIYLRGMYNLFSDYEVRRRKIFSLDDALSETHYLYGGIDHDLKEREKIQYLSTINFGGEHKIGFIDLDYELAYSQAIEDEPDRMEVSFDNPGQAIAIKFDLTDPDYPKPFFSNPDNAENAYMYDKYEMNDLMFSKSNVEDKNLTAKLNLQFNYKLENAQNGYLKLGGKFRSKEKVRDVNAQVLGAFYTSSAIYPGTAPELSLVTVDDGFREDNFLDQGYLLESMPSPDRMRDFYEFYPQYFIYDRDATRKESFNSDYKAQENIYSAYAMLRHDIGKLMLLGGVRYEQTDIDNEGRMPVLDSITGKYITVDTIPDTRSHHFLLPQLQLKYSPNEDFNIRAAWTHTFSRPNFDDAIPFRYEDRKDGDIQYGNPDLLYPKSMNLDFLIEKYLQGGGILSGGVFYKHIDDFIFYYRINAFEGDPTTGVKKLRIDIPLNGKNAFVYGAELQSQFKFNFFESFLKNFGLFLNYTYTYSEAALFKRYPANDNIHQIEFGADYLTYFNTGEEEVITLPGQAKHSANLALFYDTKKIYIKISANYHDAFLNKIGVDPDLDEYYDQAWHLDFTTSYSIHKNLKAFADIRNITNAPLRFYLGNSNRILKQEFYSWSARLGIKFQF
ncbi:MAG: TonB-dependent receptor [Bacteroidales bacterium]|nr:TonB-dependent receptor [Bacteroidales bacterium]MCF8455733.1 TonB-dependent receptor [Bacteroidales bacterium]